jgi:hypothetical protein
MNSFVEHPIRAAGDDSSKLRTPLPLWQAKRLDVQIVPRSRAAATVLYWWAGVDPYRITPAITGALAWTCRGASGTAAFSRPERVI